MKNGSGFGFLYMSEVRLGFRVFGFKKGMPQGRERV